MDTIMDARPTAIPVEDNAIPNTLKNIRNWVAWRYQYVNKKFTKLPYSPYTGRLASSTDVSTWAGFDLAMKFYKNSMMDGVGFVLSKNTGITVIDIDHCRTETCVINKDALEIVDTMNSYTELSPSGTGLHIFSYGKLPDGRRRTANIEMYDDARYITVTGKIVFGRDIEERSAKLSFLHNKFFGDTTPKGYNTIPLISTTTSRFTDDQILMFAKSGKNGEHFVRLFENGDWSEYPSPSEADLSLIGCLAFYSANQEQVDRIFRRSALMREKWEEMHGAKTYGAITIDKVFEGGNSFYLTTDTLPMIKRRNTLSNDHYLSAAMSETP